MPRVIQHGGTDVELANDKFAQGKLTLDSEQNEAAEARDRRWRVETMDLVGQAGYPAGLPESFHITLGGGGLLIGVGRMYVDGLLAENHGLSADQADVPPRAG